MRPTSLRTSELDDVGDPDAPPGSPAWSRWFVLRAKKYRKDLESDAAALQELIEKLEKHEAWKALGLPSFGMLCQLEIELSAEELDRLRGARKGETVGVVLRKHGGDRRSEEAKDQGTVGTLIESRGQTLPYLTARIRRDCPDIAERLDAGEFPSVRAAALEAGIVKPSFQCPSDPVKAARRLRRHFKGERLAALLSELARPIESEPTSEE